MDFETDRTVTRRSNKSDASVMVFSRAFC